MKTTIKIESEKPFVVLPLEDYEELIETLEILNDNPNIAEELRKEKEEFLKGNYTFYNSEKTKPHKNGARTK
ncbi:MAG: hypothetical protein L0Y79_09800 [Chlorobi bacterium]|nr:hypothetical protein [Chlorobiota bacterium]MCI0715628.1 hypothetical protein [Chlorobiota bacterium]